MRRTILVLSLLVFVQTPAQQGDATRADDALLNVVVFGTHMPIEASAYSGALKVEVDAYLRRAAAYHSTRPSPVPGGELEMVYHARVGYEIRLVSVTDDPRAAQLATDYVNRLKPCYEWEGYNDCPQREAQFADEYQAAHSGGPFSVLLPLLSAHRWLCTAEAYDYERNPTEAARARRAFDQRLSDARRSSTLLMRTAAERLAVRKQCQPRR